MYLPPPQLRALLRTLLCNRCMCVFVVGCPLGLSVGVYGCEKGLSI